MGKGKILAIKGHSTRGKEVIEVLEMLGGKNFYNWSGFGGYAYYVGVGIISVVGFFELLKVRGEEKKVPLVMKGITLLSYLAIVMSAISTQGSFAIDYRLFILNMFACLIPLIAMERKKYDAEDALFLLASTLFLGIAFKTVCLKFVNEIIKNKTPLIKTHTKACG